jgi:hypothetical protein
MHTKQIGGYFETARMRHLDHTRHRRVSGGPEHSDQRCAGIDRKPRLEWPTVGNLHIGHDRYPGRFLQLRNDPDAIAFDERRARLDEIDNAMQRLRQRHRFIDGQGIDRNLQSGSL